MKAGGQACREKQTDMKVGDMQTERQKWRYRERHAGRETEMKLGRPSLQLCGQTDKENEGLTTETKTKRTKASLQTHRQ